MKNSNRFIKKRMAARLAAVQSLYAAEFGDSHPKILAATTDEDGQQAETDSKLHSLLIKAVANEKDKYDRLINAHLDKRSPQSLELLLRLVLRCGCAELINAQETETAIVISAYVDIAKEFYGNKEPALVNAVLDKIAKSLG